MRLVFQVLVLLLTVVATRAYVDYEAPLHALDGPRFSEADFESAACREKMLASHSSSGVIIAGAAHSGRACWGGFDQQYAGPL